MLKAWRHLGNQLNCTGNNHILKLSGDVNSSMINQALDGPRAHNKVQKFCFC